MSANWFLSSCDCPDHAKPATKLALLWKVLVLVCGFAGCEFLVGHLSHSLALQADSGHMLADGLAMAIAIGSTWMAQRSTPSAQDHAVQPSRIEVWAAFVNGLGLVGMAGLIIWEAYDHLQAPATEILSVPMLITAVIGLVVNGVNVSLLHASDEQDLNLRGALLHVMADVISSIGVIVAAIAVWMWGWTWADGVISLGVALLIGGSAVPLVGQSIKELRSPRSNPAADFGPDFAPPLSSIPAAKLDTMGFCELGQTDWTQLIQSTKEG